MRRLTHLVAILLRGERAAFLRGFALTLTVLGMGAALLALSGWFILATAAAGLAGMGAFFNIFVPSAMVRLLALGRTAARYGERVLTHDATLRALSVLRVRLLRGLLGRPYREAEGLRAAAVLNRVTADVDALDGALLRLVLPALAGCVVIVVAGGAVAWIVHPLVGAVTVLGHLVVPTLVFAIGQRIARRTSRRAEAALFAGRTRMVDLVGGRDDLTVYGQVRAKEGQVQAAFGRHMVAGARLDRLERRSGVGLDLTAGAVVAVTLGLGIWLVQNKGLDPARAAVGVLAALALAEAVAPVRRALAEVGRMTRAARRILPSLDVADGRAAHKDEMPQGALALSGVSVVAGDAGGRLFDPVTLTVAPGETVALTGASGSGKSTVLLMIAGALAPTEGQVLIGDTALDSWPEADRQSRIALVPQRHALVAGTIAENLRLAAPDAPESDLWAALSHVHLDEVIRQRGGLEMRLGYRGAGLSGGEGRRLALARAILRNPLVLLLDEPTEGLDDPLARAVMDGLRRALPDTAILMAAHRSAEVDAANCVIAMHWSSDSADP